MLYRSFLVVVVLAVVVIAGCASPASSSPSDSTPVATDEVTSPLPTPGSVPSGELAGDLAERATEWLATEANVTAQDLRLVTAERTEWTDSCFGLGGPAESCLQAMTPGWRIIFEAAGQQYEVRTDETGTAFRLAPQAS